MTTLNIYPVMLTRRLDKAGNISSTNTVSLKYSNDEVGHHGSITMTCIDAIEWLCEQPSNWGYDKIELKGEYTLKEFKQAIGS